MLFCQVGGSGNHSTLCFSRLLVIFFCTLFSAAPVFLHFQCGTMGSRLNFVSWNVKGLNHPVKRRKVLSHIKQFKAAVVFLQETHLRDSDNSRLMSRWAGQHFHSTFQAKARGVSILIDQNIPFEEHNVISDTSGRYVFVSGKLCNTKVVLANIYAPDIDNVAFFQRAFSLLPDLSSYS
uniref:exodeoxyribonuclease III n=1 Tax=Astatotilapia calliptera TaxID=8154 RepID=A0AAX7U0C5_ASTCA